MIPVARAACLGLPNLVWSPTQCQVLILFVNLTALQDDPAEYNPQVQVALLQAIINETPQSRQSLGNIIKSQLFC